VCHSHGSVQRVFILLSDLKFENVMLARSGGLLVMIVAFTVVCLLNVARSKGAKVQHGEGCFAVSMLA